MTLLSILLWSRLGFWMVSFPKHKLAKCGSSALKPKPILSRSDSPEQCFLLLILEEFLQGLVSNMVGGPRVSSPRDLNPCRPALLELQTLELINYLLKLKDTLVYELITGTPFHNSSF